jgi:lipid A 3-O-deacylase
MLRALPYYTYLIIILCMVSCSRNNVNNENSDKRKLNSNRENVTNQSTLDTRTYDNIQEYDTSYISPYQVIIDTNVGQYVDHSMVSIKSRTSTSISTTSKSKISSRSGNQDVLWSGRVLTLTFDNDIFNNTDYYYTNGVNIELITPIAKQSPISKILIGSNKSQINLFGFSIMQNIYTPTNPDIADISTGDRPFSAFLTIGQFRESYNLDNHLSIKSKINFGVLGPASLGGEVQSTIHNIEPVGWDNQISNSVVIDYSVNIEKGIIVSPHFELNAITGGNLGTIYNKLVGGIYIRTGNFTPVVRGLASSSIQNNNTKTFQYWFFISGESNMIFYDATLQGGLFNNSNSYTLNNGEINHIVHRLSVGFAAYYRNIGVEIQNFYISPEFKNAYDFRWGRIKLIFNI